MITRQAITAVLACATLAFASNTLGNSAAFAQQTPEAGAQPDRIEALEQRVRDLQAVVGTLQTFARDGGGGVPGAAAPAPTAPGGGAPDELSIRVLALETQIKALTGQMEEVLQRLNQPGATPGTAPADGTSGETAPGGAMPWQQDQSAVPGDRPPPPGPPIASSQPDVLQQPSVPLPSASEGGARGVYEASYQNFVRNDLDGAQKGFQTFVKTYPDDPLATNAYYWLGRTHFDRQQYEPAAKAFLAGYKKDKQGDVAPDSLLHLGLSLSRLGEKDAACSTLSAVPRQYPGAPEQIRQSAAEAMQKTGC